MPVALWCSAMQLCEVALVATLGSAASPVRGCNRNFVSVRARVVVCGGCHSSSLSWSSSPSSASATSTSTFTSASSSVRATRESFTLTMALASGEKQSVAAGTFGGWVERPPAAERRPPTSDLLLFFFHPPIFMIKASDLTKFQRLTHFWRWHATRV